MPLAQCRSAVVGGGGTTSRPKLQRRKSILILFFILFFGRSTDNSSPSVSVSVFIVILKDFYADLILFHTVCFFIFHIRYTFFPFWFVSQEQGMIIKNNRNTFPFSHACTIPNAAKRPFLNPVSSVAEPW